MWDTGFEKAKSNGGTVNRTSLYAGAAVRKVCYEKCVMRNFAKF